MINPLLIELLLLTEFYFLLPNFDEQLSIKESPSASNLSLLLFDTVETFVELNDFYLYSKLYISFGLLTQQLESSLLLSYLICSYNFSLVFLRSSISLYSLRISFSWLFFRVFSTIELKYSILYFDNSGVVKSWLSSNYDKSSMKDELSSFNLGLEW